MTDQHNPNCAIVRLGDIRAWCDCGANLIKALEAENERLREALRKAQVEASAALGETNDQQ